VVRGDAAVGDAVIEVARQTLGGTPALSEDQRGPVGLDQLGDLLERGFPDGVARRRQEVVHRRDHLKIEVAREAGVDRLGVGAGGAGQERQRRLDGAHGRRAADTLRALAGVGLDQCLQALERERQVGAALRSHQRVDLVDDQEPCAGERRSESLAGEQNEERFGRGDQDVRGPARHGLALGRQRVAGSHGDADLGRLEPVGGGRGPDARQGRAQVLLDVVVERAERGDVHDVDPIFEPALEAQAMEVVERPQEGRQGLARARRRHDERVAARGDGVPALALRPGGLRERRVEPAADERKEFGHSA
jgi:hypothetical protein